jgi:hypothetical protein
MIVRDARSVIMWALVGHWLIYSVTTHSSESDQPDQYR